MKKCPYCMEEIPEDSMVCKFCGSSVVKKCPFCAEEINALAQKCRFCRSDLDSATGEPASRPSPVKRRPAGPLGEERGMVETLLLCIVTCGIWGLVLTYKMGEELNAHQGKKTLNPGLDLVLCIVTCGFWGVYLMYKYPKTLQDIAVEEEMPASDVLIPCILLACFGLWIVSLMILQSEFNRHWEAHGTLDAAGL